MSFPDVDSDLEFFKRDTEHRLCNACQSFFAPGTFEHHHKATNGTEGKSFLHHQTPASFVQAVSQACYICVKVQQDIGSSKLNSSYGTLSLDTPAIRLEIVSSIFGQEHGNGQSVSSSFEVTDVTEHASIYRTSHASLQQQQVGNLSTVKLISSWLSKCSSQYHMHCGDRVGAIPTFFPTRLLDVSDSKIRIVETAENFEPASYITMSYCWGKKPFLKLEPHSIDLFKKNILLADMPRSIQHVIFLVRQLGIRYLWVDSFCIIQAKGDEKLDWHNEGKTMGQIYSNALLNIGVSEGADVHTGCCLTRQRRIEPPLCVPWSSDEKDIARLYHVCPSYGIARYFEAFDKSTLLRRGWVFQERLLCSKMLYLTADQVYWECSGFGQLLACEEYPAGMKSPMSKIDIYPWSMQSKNSRLRNGTQGPLELWSALVRQYSRLQLTYVTKDKLVAISGAAKRMSEIMEDQYMAGMFKTHLMTQLPWTIGNNSSRASTWRAPSWSWASIDGPIELPFFGRHALATISHVELKLAYDDSPFGALLSGFLQLCCRPIPCDLVPRKDHISFLTVADSLMEWTPDNVDDCHTMTDVHVVFTNVSGYNYASPKRDQRMALDEVMMIAKEPTALIHTREQINLDGIVLRKVSDSTYVRVGALNRASSFDHFALWYRMKEVVITIL